MNTKFLVDMENVRKQMKTLMNALAHRKVMWERVCSQSEELKRNGVSGCDEREKVIERHVQCFRDNACELEGVTCLLHNLNLLGLEAYLTLDSISYDPRFFKPVDVDAMFADLYAHPEQTASVVVLTEEDALECAIKTISGALALGNVLVSGSLVGQFHYYLGQPIGKLKRLQADAIKRMGA